MSWRARQTAATKRQIVETFRELGSGPDAKPPTVAEVSRASGISPATIYRHFPTRDDLVAAASFDRSTLGVGDVDRWTFDHLRDHLVALWSELAQNLPVTREGALSLAGRELRDARYRAFREQVTAAIGGLGLDPGDPDVERFVHALALLASVHAFLDLHERQHLSAEAAADVVDWAVRVLARQVGIDPERAAFPASFDPVTADDEEASP